METKKFKGNGRMDFRDLDTINWTAMEDIK